MPAKTSIGLGSCCPTGRRTALGLLHYGLAIDAATAKDRATARQHTETLLEIAEALDDDRLRGRGFAALGFTELIDGNTAAAQAAAGRAREIARRIGDDYTFVSNALWEISTLAWAGRYEELAEKVPVSLREVELVGMINWRGPLLRVNLASAYLILGRWDESLATIEQVLAAEPEPLYRIGTCGMLATIRAYRGEFDQAAAVLHTPDELAAGSPVLRNYILGYVTSVWCELAMARQDPESAGHAVEVYLRHCAGPDVIPDEDGLLGIAMLQRARLAAAPRNREIAAEVAAIRATIGELVAQLPHGRGRAAGLSLHDPDRDRPRPDGRLGPGRGELAPGRAPVRPDRLPDSRRRGRARRQQPRGRAPPARRGPRDRHQVPQLCLPGPDRRPRSARPPRGTDRDPR